MCKKFDMFLSILPMLNFESMILQSCFIHRLRQKTYSNNIDQLSNFVIANSLEQCSLKYLCFTNFPQVLMSSSLIFTIEPPTLLDLMILIIMLPLIMHFRVLCFCLSKKYMSYITSSYFYIFTKNF